MDSKTIKYCYCFDLDDTLIKTPAKIHIYRNGVYDKSLTPKEYNFYKYHPEDKLDFSDFTDGELILNAKKHVAWPIIEKISNLIKSGKSSSVIYILTARDSTVKSYIYELLKQNGIEIEIENIITIGDNKSQFNIAKEKEKTIKFLKLKYDKIIVFDDNPETVKLARNVPGIETSLIEKFIEDSDPIADMGIGMKHLIKKWVKTETEHDYNEEDLLWICAKYGKLEFVKYLLDVGADVHAGDDYALQWASEKGHTDVVKLLLDAGADVHARDDGALRWASGNGQVDVVKFLLDAGADVHAGDDYALRWASGKGHADVVKLLLDAGADVHAHDDGALRWASSSGHADVVKILKDHIAKEKKNKVVKESLSEKFVEDSDPISDLGIGKLAQIKKWYKTKEGDDSSDYYELLRACTDFNKIDFIKFLLENYLDHIDLNAHKCRLLRVSAFNGRWKVCLILIEYGADLEKSIIMAREKHERVTLANLIGIKDALKTNQTSSLVDEMMMGVGSTPGMGNATPATSVATTGAQMSSPSSTGSGDNFGNTLGNRLYTQNKSVKTKRKRRKPTKKRKYVKEDVNEKFIENSDPIKDMNIGVTGLWDYTIEDAAKEIWALMKPRIQKRITATQRFNSPYTVSSHVITERGCEDLGFEPNKHTLSYLVKLVQKEIDKSIADHTLSLPPNVKYLKINEENLNPYDKIKIVREHL